ncbi:PPE family protein, partial [Mycobacterium sp.]|uniref:PPE family protein n=1 Tax=Mycobacterium sp. TaxID=1785 RepID=UPI003C712AE9
IEASNAWQRIGTDLDETSQSYVTVISELSQGWGGPSEAAMSNAVEPYLTWLRNTAQQCQQLGNSALAATVAFNSAVTTVVPVATVTANRVQLAQLLATNGFGKNLAAIAETEAQYQEMWVNNASALYRYEASSAQATTLSLFTSPPTIVNSAAAAQATTAANSAATDPLSTLTSILQSLQSFPDDQLVTNPWFQLANTYVNQYLSSGFPINLLSYFAQTSSAQALQAVAPEVGQGLSEGEAALGAAGASIGASLSSAVKGIGAAAEAPTVLVGAAVPMGNLSAPPAAAGLMTASPPVQLASAVSPLPNGDAGFPMLPPLMAPPLSAGSGWSKRKNPKYEDLAMGLEVKGTIMPRNPSAG